MQARTGGVGSRGVCGREACQQKDVLCPWDDERRSGKSSQETENEAAQKKAGRTLTPRRNDMSYHKQIARPRDRGAVKTPRAEELQMGNKCTTRVDVIQEFNGSPQGPQVIR